MPLILDASVAVAWFVRDQADAHTDRIRRLARRQRLHVPAIWPLEFANALWQLQRRRILSPAQIDTIVDLAEPLDIAVHPEVPTSRRALGLARKYDLSAYDASYLDLALALRYPVACRDGALKRALRQAGIKPA